MNLSLSIARTIMKALQTRAAARFARQARRPAETQLETLRRILRRNQDTEIGRRYSFATIHDAREYSSRVPVVTAEELAPLVDRMAAGDAAVLTAQKPRYFCQTGGTTGEPKLSPVTPDYTREYQGTIHTWLYHVRRDHPDIFGGKTLYFVGTAEAGRTPDGTPFGTMTGYNFSALPAFMQRLYALPYQVGLIDDYEAKYYTVLRLALAQDVRFLISVTPSTLLLLGRKLEQFGEPLLSDLAAGSLRDDLKLSGSVRRALGPLLRPRPDLARDIEQRCHGRAPRPLDVWPNLRLLACWKSGPSAPYIKELAPYYGATPVRDAIYSATEGWMNIPMSDELVGGALAVGTHFFEFFEEDDTKRTGTAFLAQDLEVGRRYAIILTASSGMYRYDIKDIVTCVGRYHETPIIAFSHKESGFSNLVGEKLSDHHVSTAVASAAEAAGLRLSFFTVAPDSGVPPAYVAHVEFADVAPDQDQARLFLERLERTLGEQAWEYAGHRRAGDLGPPELSILAPGSNDQVRQAFLARGGNEAQMKPRHLVPELAAICPGLEELRRVKL